MIEISIVIRAAYRIVDKRRGYLCRSDIACYLTTCTFNVTVLPSARTVIEVEPTLLAVTRPEALTEAMFAFRELKAALCTVALSGTIS